MTKSEIEFAIRLLVARVDGIQQLLNRDTDVVDIPRTSLLTHDKNMLNWRKLKPRQDPERDPGDDHIHPNEFRAMRQEEVNSLRGSGSFRNDLQGSLSLKIRDLRDRGLSTASDQAAGISGAQVAEAADRMLRSAECHLDGGTFRCEMRVSDHCRIFAEAGWRDGSAKLDSGIICEF
ncbi:MAG: hypothetical protein NTU79_05155 [Planctomycetota bacterium]|nr:hypothetical protein [Planctomycetota bacterium]